MMSSFLVCGIRNQMEDVMGAKCGTREERLMHRVLLFGEGT